MTQNMPSRLVCRWKKFDLVTPLLRERHWLPMGLNSRFYFCVWFTSRSMVSDRINSVTSFRKQNVTLGQQPSKALQVKQTTCRSKYTLTAACTSGMNFHSILCPCQRTISKDMWLFSLDDLGKRRFERQWCNHEKAPYEYNIDRSTNLPLNWLSDLFCSFGTNCDENTENADVLFPAVRKVGNTTLCIVQRRASLFSCAKGKETFRRVCPCRDYIKHQMALCKDC
jgi:hypothetical protein